MSSAYYRRITAGAAHFRHSTIPPPQPHLAGKVLLSSPRRKHHQISLRLLSNRCTWLIKTVPVGPTAVQSEKNSGDDKEEINKAVEIEKKEVTKAEVVAAAAVTVALGVGNRVLYKLALVPLKHYPFFLAQLATFGYFSSFEYFDFNRLFC